MTPKIAVGITAFNRPDCLYECLASLRGQLDGCPPVYLHIDGGGDRKAEMWSVAMGCRLDITVRLESENLGVNHNTKGTMDWIWSEGYDWAVYLEDDLVLSSDAMRLARWYVDNADAIDTQSGVGQIGAYCLCRLGGGRDPGGIILTRAFLGWGFLMSRAQYRAIEPAWLSGEKDDPPSMWDRHVARRIRGLSQDCYNCMPILSRVTNIGRDGVHFTPGAHDKWMAGHEWNESSLRYAFQLAGWADDALEHRGRIGDA